MLLVLPTISRLVEAERAFGSIILDRLNMEWEGAQKARKTEDKEKQKQARKKGKIEVDSSID
jgi:hypothetical protein